MKEKKFKVAATGIAGGNGVMECVNLINAGVNGGLRTLTSAEWSEIKAKTTGKDEETSSGTREFERKAADYPSVTFKIREEGTMQAQTGSFTPKDGDLRRLNPLSEKDLENYSEMLESAYRSMYIQAGTGNMLIQPIILRYKLLDGEGRTLFTSLPQIAASNSGWQLCDVMEAKISKRSDTDFTIESLTLTAKAYSLWVTIPETEPESDVRTVEIEMSYPLHPLDFDEESEVRTVNASGNTPTARIGLPRATTGLASRNEERAERLRQMLAHSEKTLPTVKRFGIAGERQVMLQPESLVGVKAIRMMTDKILSEEPALNEGGNETMANVNIPHGFKAERMTSSGDTTLYSGITPLPYEGTDPKELVGFDDGDEEIRIRSTVRLTNGRAVRKEVTITGDFGSLSVNPIAGFPGKDALSMTIEAKRGNEMKGLELELTPTADAKMAINIAPDMKKRAMTAVDATTWDEPYNPPAPERLHEGTLLCGRTGDRGRITGTTRTEGAIRGCVATDRGTGSWDNSKGHFYLLTEKEIEGVTAEGKTGSISVTELCRSKVETDLTAGEGCYYGVTDEGIVKLSGGKAETIVRGMRVKRLGWSERLGMLVVLTASDVKVLIDSKGRRYEVTEEEDEFRWRGTVKTDGEARGLKVRSVSVKIRGDDVRGNAEVTCYGKGREELLSRVSFDRNIDEPLVINGIVSPRRWLAGVRVKGTSKRMMIEGVEISCNE